MTNVLPAISENEEYHRSPNSLEDRLMPTDSDGTDSETIENEHVDDKSKPPSQTEVG